jgi:hypothetical protein
MEYDAGILLEILQNILKCRSSAYYDRLYEHFDHVVYLYEEKCFTGIAEKDFSGQFVRIKHLILSKSGQEVLKKLLGGKSTKVNYN